MEPKQAANELSIIIPAYNEAEELPHTLETLRHGVAAAGRRGEIIVVDNASADTTAEIARSHGAHVVHEPHRQISRARNTGARASNGDWLLFVDADTRPPPQLLAGVLEHLNNDACGGGALLAFEGTTPSGLYNHGTRAWNALAQRMNLAAGCFVFARRDAFEAVGGFDERLYAGDEVIFSRRMQRWGLRYGGRPFVIIQSPPVLTSQRKAQWFSLGRHISTLLLIAACPWALRSRYLMSFWYKRPVR